MSDDLQSIRIEHVQGRHGDIRFFGSRAARPTEMYVDKTRVSGQQNTLQEDIWL
jgi:hypothetical protein